MSNDKILDENTPIAERAVVFEEALEAILFAAGHPISYATLARVFEMTPGKVKDRVFEYSLQYNNPQIPRGVILLTYSESCQLCTKEWYLNEIRDALNIKKSGTLSTSSMEALAIVAYNQPVTRAFVDTLRRVDSSYAMNNLIDRGLIESRGRLDVPGRPMLYGTTTDFLRCFGLNDLSELPSAGEDISTLFEKAKAAEEAENEPTEPTEQTTGEQVDTPQQSDPTTAEPTYEDEPSADDDIHEMMDHDADAIADADDVTADADDVNADADDMTADADDVNADADDVNETP